MEFIQCVGDRDLLEVHCNQGELGLCARGLLHSSLTFFTLRVVNGGGEEEVKQCVRGSL